MPELVLTSGFFLLYLVEETLHQLVQLGGEGDHLVHGRQPSETEITPSSREERSNSCCDATNHNDMEMQDRSKSIGGDPGYNPKYSVRLSLSTSSVFPNYQSPDSLKPAPQGKPPILRSQLLISLRGRPNLLRVVFTVLALSFHAVFEGLAIGLEDSDVDVWKMLAAIASHKFVITFCISLELLQADGTAILRFCLFLISFSLVSPLGIGVGHAVSGMADQSSEVHQVTVAVLQGLAGGAILYLVIFEILLREKRRWVPGLLQLVGIIILGFWFLKSYNFCHQFGILLGFMVMLVIELISSDTTENDEDMELVNGTKTKIVDLEEGSWTGLVENPDMQVGFRMFSTK